MTKQKFLHAFLLLFILAATNFLQLNAQTATGVKASVQYIQAPLFKGLSQNGMMRIRIYVPAGKEATYRNLQLNLDNEALKAIDKVSVLVRNDKEAGLLSTAPVVASVTPTTNLVNIPLELTCKPGLNYIWISATLKQDANIDKKAKITAVALTAANGTKLPLASATNNAFRLGVAVRKAWDDSVHTYRIPGMITTDKGTLVAVYDIRYKHAGDLPANIDVGMSRSTDGGKTWEPMKIIMDMGAPHANNGIGDPAVLFDPVTKKLWVAALWSKGDRSIRGSEPGLSPDTTGQFVLVSSDDDGRTWSAPYSITTQVKDPKWHLYFNGPGNGIAMQNGTLVFPSQYWDESKKPGMPHSSIIYSTDHGKTWKSGVGAKSNTTEAQVVETTPGTLMLNMRDNRGGYRSVATTTDLGKTWVEHHTSQQALIDPTCMASIIRASVTVKGKKRDVLFFSNVAEQHSRQNTTIKASPDLGESWPAANAVMLDERRSYGYSALTKVDENTIGILYEGERDLYFVRVAISEIIK